MESAVRLAPKNRPDVAKHDKVSICICIFWRAVAMKRTTILADDDLLLEIQQIAARRGTTLTAVVQDALRTYVVAHRQPRQISFIGMGDSGSPPLDLRDGRDEAILAAEIDPIFGWSP